MPVGEISQRTATAAPSERAASRERYPGLGSLGLSAANRVDAWAPDAVPRQRYPGLGSLGLSANRAPDAAEPQMDDGLSSRRRERDAALDRVRELEAAANQRTGELEAANQRIGELEAANQRIGELEAELSRATARGDDWKHECKRQKAENDRLRTQS